MAPQNLNQVFVINDPAMYDTTTFANTAAVTASKLGVVGVLLPLFSAYSA